jgi:hypothetical protein
LFGWWKGGGLKERRGRLDGFEFGRQVVVEFG